LRATPARSRSASPRPGYDAEATVNWKTGKIVYTSRASGDLDLWSMKPDGSEKKQLTKGEGYDGAQSSPGRQENRVARQPSADT
jgi:Tol biopolymer transport system component